MMQEQPLINHQQKFVKPTNISISYTDLGSGQSLMVVTQSCSISMLFGVITNPRYPTHVVCHSHLEALIYNQNFWSCSRTSYIQYICSSSEFEKIRMSLRQIIQHMSSRLLRAQFIYTQNVAGVLASPNGMTVYLKYSYLVWKAIIHSLPSLI